MHLRIGTTVQRNGITGTIIDFDRYTFAQPMFPARPRAPPGVRDRHPVVDLLARGVHRGASVCRAVLLVTVTAFWRLAPDPTPDPAGLARWIARAHRLLASGQIGSM